MSKYNPIDPYKHNSHGIYLSGPFEVEEQIFAEQGYPTKNRTYIMSIGCTRADRNNLYLYKIKGTGLSCYRLDAALMISSRYMTEKTEDKIGMTGTGIILSIDKMVEECMQYMKGDDGLDPITTVVTLQHCNHHPITKQPFSCKLKYRLRPYRHLAGTPKILKVGRKVNIHGYIKDFNETTKCFVTIVNKISLTSGHVIPGLTQFGKGVTDPLQTLQSGSSKATESTVVGSSDNEASISLGMPTEESSSSLFGG
ncbi:hypothetical protein DFH28DRAFT_1136482 [Melampsora americana]|nr:hypothetical protein DFH28DRAFT_1136482 [Melampsora americana]